jgi:hypothetical protein
VTYFVVARLVLINRISLWHYRLVGYGRPGIKCGAGILSSEVAVQTGIGVLLLNRKTSTERAALCCLVLGGLGVWIPPHGALGAPSPRCTWWRPRYAQKNLARACASSPEISWGGHGVWGPA